MIFKNRKEAGRALAKALEGYKGENVIVLALPRGGVPVANEVAKAFHAPLDLVIARKIGHPTSPEYAIGAVGESGATIFNKQEIESVPKEWLKGKIEEEKNEAKRRRALYSGGRPARNLHGKTVIVVDDGIATGLTMRAALADVRKHKPKEIIVALPVAPAETVEVLKNEADKVFVLYAPAGFFGAVGQYYLDFPQLTDEEVIKMMQHARS